MDKGVRNYGVDLERERAESSHEDWVYGAASTPCIALIPENERAKYLPDGEVQRGRDDYMDCASRGPINELEAKFTYLYKNDRLDKDDVKFLKNNGYVKNNRVTFSDRHIAIKSGTTRMGNSLKAPLQAIHEFGLVPKSMLPGGSKFTFVQYHDPKNITPEMEALGMEFLAHFTINYEKVPRANFDMVINEDFIDVAGFAWPAPGKDGVYPKDNRPINHVFLYFQRPRYLVFDNYIDSADNDYIKKLATDYLLLDYGYRLFISEAVWEEHQKDLLARIAELYEQIMLLMAQLKKKVGGLLGKAL